MEFPSPKNDNFKRMKQKISILLCILIGVLSVEAQNEKFIQELNPFQEVKAYDGLSINLIKSDVNRAVVTGANTKDVAFVNKDGVLKIRMNITKLFSGYRTFVDLYYTDQIMVIDTNEDAKITSNESIAQTVLTLKAQEGGELVINTAIEMLHVKSIMGGKITTSGSAHTQEIYINTGGSYNGKDCKTKVSTVSVNAGSRAVIHATDHVDANVKAGGEVLVYGNPKKMDKTTIFGGKIIRM